MSGTARGEVGSRVGLKRLAPGLHETAGGLLIRRLGYFSWIVTFDGDPEPLLVRGRDEFFSLTEAAGCLADHQEDLARRRAA